MTTPQPASAPFVAKQGSIYRAGVHLADCAYPIIATRWAAILNAHAGLVAAMYANPDTWDKPNAEIASVAVRQADALIAALTTEAK